MPQGGTTWTHSQAGSAPRPVPPSRPVPELPRRSPDELFDQLGTRRLLIVSGKGGVGRTTVAVLLGSALAARGRRVLIATTGHDDRLAWMLGGDQLLDVPVEIAPGLAIQRLNPSICAEEYGALVTHSQRLSHVVFGNKIVRRLLRAIPGFDDFAVLGKVWHEAIRARSYDVVVFDGPASGHLRLVLGVPNAIVETISDGPLAREAMAIRAALRDPTLSQAVLVGLPEPWPLTELAELSDALRDEIGLSVGVEVVNKLWPRELPQLEAPARELDDDSSIASMFATIARVGQRGDDQAEVVGQWLRGRPHEALLTVPWWPWGVEGPEGVAALLAAIMKGSDASGAAIN
jgi:anion-transporting  ArsA/GET3 family ATPase